jgi:hypothetical protein
MNHQVCIWHGYAGFDVKMRRLGSSYKQALNDVKLALKKLEEENGRVRASIAGRCNELSALEAAFVRAQQQQTTAAATLAKNRQADVNLT